MNTDRTTDNAEPDKAGKLFEAAIRAEDAGDSDKALRLYEQALLIDPTVSQPRIRLASLLYDVGKWKEAISVARQLTKRWPKFSAAYVVIARSYGELGRWKMAERFYRQSLAIKQEPWTWLLLGWALDRLKRHDEAEECLRKALKVDPDYEEAHYNLGYIYRTKGKLALAEKHLRRAIEIDPKYELAFAELGQLLADDRAKEALSLLRRAVKHDPNDGWSRAYLAAALKRLRKLKAADEQYCKLLELWPNDAMSNWLYGDFLAAHGKEWSTAEPYLRKAVEIEPKNEWANYYLGKYLLCSDRNEEAKGFLTKAARQGHSRARKLLRGIKSTRSPKRR